MRIHPRIHLPFACLALVLTSACSDDGSAPVVPVTPGDPVYRWTNPLSQRSTLTDVWGPSIDNLMATGNDGLVLRYDGKTWRRTQVAGNPNLNAIWGADGQAHAFAVGQDGAILFFNGSAWTAQTSPTTATLNDVWGSSMRDVYAVGQQRELVHFDGTEWERVPMGAGIESFYSIWGGSATNIYIAGPGKNLLHYDGAAWSEDSTAASFSLSVVWGTDSLDVFALGPNGAAVHYDGEWSNIDVGEPLYPTTVWGTATDDVYAMGIPGAAGSAYHWNGFNWTRVEMNSLKGINRVFGVDDEVIAVGEKGLIHEKSGDAFVSMTGGNVADLFAVWVSPSGTEAFAAGELGTILHYQDHAWRQMTSGTTANLRGLAGVCSFNLLAVGENGVVLHYDGGAWSDISPGPATVFHAAWMDASGTALVVGDGGVVERLESGAWTPASLGSHGLLSVWGSSLDDIYVVGTESAAFRWNGSSFKPITVAATGTHSFHCVHGTSASDVFVASEVISVGPNHAGGNIFHFDGEAWTPVYSDPVHDVLSVWRHGKQGFATGDSGSILRDDGTHGWVRVGDVDNLPFYVNSVSGSSSANAFIAGNDGSIIRFSP